MHTKHTGAEQNGCPRKCSQPHPMAYERFLPCVEHKQSAHRAQSIGVSKLGARRPQSCLSVLQTQLAFRELHLKLLGGLPKICSGGAQAAPFARRQLSKALQSTTSILTPCIALTFNGQQSGCINVHSCSGAAADCTAAGYSLCAQAKSPPHSTCSSRRCCSQPAPAADPCAALGPFLSSASFKQPS